MIAPANADKKAVEAAFREGVILGESQNFTRTLVNEPGNRMTPTVLGERAAAMCKEQGLPCEVHSTEKIKELKMGAFWAVAQGSDEPPALIVMRYEPKDAPKDGPVLALVGKGITFDTGGISIKPSDGMEKMKYDMAGGAAMIGAMRAIAQLKPKVRVIGIVCSAENMPSGKAYRPGDVAIAMSGKAIEVLNTDAEGRMVLADGLHYAKQLGATHLIDAATLTGACVVALGMVNAGVFANDEASYEHFQKALAVSGERFWRLPLEDEYREMIVSHIGDITNTGGSRYGGAITAAMFLKEFVDETPWLHLDIAGVAWMDEPKPWIQRDLPAWPCAALWSGCAATSESREPLNGSEKLAARNNASRFPCLRKMAQVAGNQVVGMGGFRAFQEHVVFRVRANQEVRLGRNDDGRTFNAFDDLLLRSLREAEFSSRKNFRVLLQNWRRDIGPEFSAFNASRRMCDSSPLRFRTAETTILVSITTRNKRSLMPTVAASPAGTPSLPDRFLVPSNCRPHRLRPASMRLRASQVLGPWRLHNLQRS